MATYKIIWPSGAEEKTLAAFSAPNTGVTHNYGSIVEITEIQKNIPGVAEWGHLSNGNWIATIYNSRVRAEPIILPSPSPEPTPTPEPSVDLDVNVRLTEGKIFVVVNGKSWNEQV